MLVDSVACAEVARVEVVLELKAIIPGPLLEADAPWSGAHEGPWT